MAQTIAQEIEQLIRTGGADGRPLEGLTNDARYWDLRRTYGDHSIEVLRHLQACSAAQQAR